MYSVVTDTLLQNIHCTAELPSHLSIPQLKFVEAGVFTVMSGDAKHSKSGSNGPTRTYLIEEKINVPPDGTFTKYIHNGSPCPVLESFDAGYDICLFLCACQHLQYIKTHKVAYVTDYQGYGNLLTDVQIMTSP